MKVNFRNIAIALNLSIIGSLSFAIVGRAVGTPTYVVQALCFVWGLVLGFKLPMVILEDKNDSEKNSSDR